MTEKEYGRLVQARMPRSPMWRDCLNAFWIGGLICTIGQLIMNGYAALGLDKTDAGKTRKNIGKPVFCRSGCKGADLKKGLSWKVTSFRFLSKNIGRISCNFGHVMLTF